MLLRADFLLQALLRGNNQLHPKLFFKYLIEPDMPVGVEIDSDEFHVNIES